MSIRSNLPNLNTVQRWVRFAGKPAGVTVVLSVTTLAANVLIFRLLVPAQAGQFSLLVAIAQTLAVLTGLGQSTVMQRFYSRHALGHYNWFADLLQTQLITLPGILVSSLIVQRIYHLDGWQALFVFLVTIGVTNIGLLSGIFGSQQRYVWGAVILRLPFNLLMLALLPMIVLPESSRFNYLMAAYAGILGLVLSLGVTVGLKLLPRGPARLGWADRKWGGSFLVSGLTYQLPEEGLLSIAGLMVNPAQLAAVAAFTLLLRPFGLLYDTLNQLLITELGRRPQLRLRPMALALFALSLGLGVAVTLAAPFVSIVLYDGRYNDYLFLVPFLVAGATLQLTEVLGRCYITVTSSQRMLNQFVAINVLIALMGTGLTVALITQVGVLGLAIGIVVIYACRNVVSYALSYQIKRNAPAQATDPTPLVGPQ